MTQKIETIPNTFYLVENIFLFLENNMLSDQELTMPDKQINLLQNEDKMAVLDTPSSFFGNLSFFLVTLTLSVLFNKFSKKNKKICVDTFKEKNEQIGPKHSRTENEKSKPFSLLDFFESLKEIKKKIAKILGNQKFRNYYLRWLFFYTRAVLVAFGVRLIFLAFAMLLAVLNEFIVRLSKELLRKLKKKRYGKRLLSFFEALQVFLFFNKNVIDLLATLVALLSVFVLLTFLAYTLDYLPFGIFSSIAYSMGYAPLESVSLLNFVVYDSDSGLDIGPKYLECYRNIILSIHARIFIIRIAYFVLKLICINLKELGKARTAKGFQPVYPLSKYQKLEKIAKINNEEQIRISLFVLVYFYIFGFSSFYRL